MSNSENKVTAAFIKVEGPQSWNKNPNLPSEEWFPHNPAILDEYGNRLSYEALLKEFWNVLRDNRDLRMEKNENPKATIKVIHTVKSSDGYVLIPGQNEELCNNDCKSCLTEDSKEPVTLDSLVQKLAELTAEMNNYLVDNVSSDANVTNAIIRDILHREAKDYPPFW